MLLLLRLLLLLLTNLTGQDENEYRHLKEAVVVVADDEVVAVDEKTADESR